MDFQVKIAGAAGEGIMAVGLLLARAFSRSGFYVFNSSDYPSLIRGGHNSTTVRAAEKKIASLNPQIEVLVAMNAESFEWHEDELVPGGILIWDQVGETSHSCKEGVHCIHVPFRDIAKSLGNPIVLNTVSLGALAAALNFPLSEINHSLEAEFGRKGKEIVRINQQAAREGFEFIHKNYKDKLPADLSKFIKKAPQGTSRQTDRVVMTGNEACAVGAIAAGCQFYAGYPMTPSTGIFHTMASLAPKVGMVFKQSEDEIAAINMAIGASYAGVRAMTASSGGGFALMTEAVGLAAMTETPVVIVVASRPGPATGLPTWTEQGDLRQVLHAAQGDFPRLVVAPGDTDEAIRLTKLAFDVAEEYQIPAIVLTDKNLAESYMSTTWLTKAEQKISRAGFISDSQLKNCQNYKRYEITEDGVSPRAVPGQKNGQFVANSDEHNEFGFSSEDGINRRLMMEKRFRKLDRLRAHLPGCQVYGSRQPEVTLFSFGSNKWIVREAVDILATRKLKASAVHLPVLCPLPVIEIAHLLERSPKNIVVENNYTGQLEGLIRQETGYSFDDHLRRYDGRSFLAEEVADYIKGKI